MYVTGRLGVGEMSEALVLAVVNFRGGVSERGAAGGGLWRREFVVKGTGNSLFGKLSHQLPSHLGLQS